MGRSGIRFVQLSDLHLFANTTDRLLGVNTQESFQAVSTLMREKEKRVDFVLLSGDLSHDGSASSYQRLANTCQPWHLPIYYIPGNHDNVTVMQTVYPSPPILQDRQIVLDQWQVILLNSHKRQSIAGFLAEEALGHLQTCLAEYPDKYALVVLHHQPVWIGSHWLDRLGLMNREAFWKCVAAYPTVQAVLFGHIHQQHEALFKRIPCYSTPATSIQFAPHRFDFALDPLPPGYRWVEIYPNGSLVTGVRRVDSYIGYFDKEAKGY